MKGRVVAMRLGCFQLTNKVRIMYNKDTPPSHYWQNLPLIIGGRCFFYFERMIYHGAFCSQGCLR